MPKDVSNKKKPVPRIITVTDHFIEKCKNCNKTVSQCRCPVLINHKRVHYVLCEDCKNLIAEEAKIKKSKEEKEVKNVKKNV